MGSTSPSTAFSSDPNVDTLRRVVLEHGILGPEALSAYVPSAEVAVERERARRAFVETLMGAFERDAEA